MSSTKILLTGATGYIGGSVLNQLLNTENELIKASRVTVLVRGENNAKRLGEMGVETVLFESLDDTALLEKVASQHDVVIHTASGFHPPSAAALIRGLGKRRKEVGGDPRYIHTSGVSNFADRPITGQHHETREFVDTDLDLYAYLKKREAQSAYPQRTTDVTVVETGKEEGIRTYIIVAPTVYGVGSGIGKTYSGQIPKIIQVAIEDGYVSLLGDGKGVWNYVHVLDLAKLYELLLGSVLKGEVLPYGERGFYFCGSGQFNWEEMAQGVANAGFELGALKTKEPETVNLEEATQKFAGGDAALAELCLASNSRTRAVLAELLGWRPKKSAEDFKKNFMEEFRIFYKATSS